MLLRRHQPRTTSTSHIERSETGAVTVEFALIIGILMMIIFGIIEFGIFFSRYQMVQSAAREGARIAAVRGTEAEISAQITDAAEPYTVDLSTMSVTVDGVSGPCTSNTRGQQVVVKWTQPFNDAIVLPFIPDVDITTDVQGVFRCE